MTAHSAFDLSLLCPLEASVFYMHNILPPLVFLAIRQSNRWRAGGQPFWALEINTKSNRWCALTAHWKTILKREAQRAHGQFATLHVGDS